MRATAASAPRSRPVWRAARAPWVTFLPADGQIGPDAIATLRSAAATAHADVVFSVYADRDDGVDRKVLSFGVRALVRADPRREPSLRRAVLVPARAVSSRSSCRPTRSS